MSRLLDAGYAYTDYATPEEVQAERESAQAAKRNPVYSRRWMATTDAERAAFEAEGRRAVVRLKMPREGECRFEDHVRGDVRVRWELEQDHVIQRADGSCLYHLANVVDDHDMQISHVIRATEHLSNTPRQLFIADGLGITPPEYAHVPFVAEPGSKTKLSKRKLQKYLKHPDFAHVYEHGRAVLAALGEVPDADTFNPVIVDFYERVGYEPDALVNYLLLLGWSLDDKTEHLSRADMIDHFSLDRINTAPASFDPKKLLAFQEHYMNALSVADRAARSAPYLARALHPDPVDPARLEAVVAAAGDRIKVAGDILQFVDFFLPDDTLSYDEKAFAKRLRKPPDAAPLLESFRAALADTTPFTAGAIEATLERFVAERGVAIGAVIHAVRVAVTGKAVGFGLFDAVAILGRDQALARIDRALARVAAGTPHEDEGS